LQSNLNTFGVVAVNDIAHLAHDVDTDASEKAAQGSSLFVAVRLFH
jgi:hypothetical protein